MENWLCLFVLCFKVQVSDNACADPESFFQRGSNYDYVLLVDEDREDPNATKSGLSSARQRNAIY